MSEGGANHYAVDRVLVAGLGSIGRRHVDVARKVLPNAEIAVLRHRDCSEEAYPGVDRCFTHIEQAVQFEPDLAVVANPASSHLQVAKPLAAAGIPLLIEKPLAAHVEGVQEFIQYCAARGVTLMVGYNLRFATTLERLRDLLRANRIGRVLSVRAEAGQFLPDWRPTADYRKTVSANAAMGGGVLLELSHEIDYLRWLFGEVEFVSAVVRRQSDLEIDVEDVAHLTLGQRFDADAATTVVNLSVDFFRRDPVRMCTVIGTDGSLRWNALAGTVEIFEPDQLAWTQIFSDSVERDTTYVSEWRHLLSCIAEGSTPRITGWDGLAALHVVEAARKSSASGRVEHLTAEFSRP